MIWFYNSFSRKWNLPFFSHILKEHLIFLANLAFLSKIAKKNMILHYQNCCFWLDTFLRMSAAEKPVSMASVLRISRASAHVRVSALMQFVCIYQMLCGSLCNWLVNFASYLTRGSRTKQALRGCGALGAHRANWPNGRTCVTNKVICRGSF